MSAPTPYSLVYDFTAFQASNPSTPLPADKIEIEYNAIALTTGQIITNLGLIQRSDGALANQVVTYDTLSNTVKALLGSAINPLGSWVTATSYDVLDLVEQSGSTYICAVDHTSGVFATDLAADKWVLWAAGNAVSINNDNWSGTDLAVENGGTGRSSHTAYAVICGGTTGTGAQQSVASVGTSGQVLLSAGAGNLPAFGHFSSLTTALSANSQQVRFSKGADVASANALTLGTDGNYFDITGTTSITSIGTLAVGTIVKLHFDGALTLTHHATDLILPGGTNITTAAGDEAEFVEYASGDWRCVSYVKASGLPVVSPSSTSGLVLLATATASASASVDFTSGIDSTYDQYLLTGVDVTVQTDNVSLYLRTDSSGGASFDTGGSDYTNSYTLFGIASSSTGGSASATSGGKAQIELGFSLGNATQEKCHFHAWIKSPASANNTIVDYIFSGVDNGGAPTYAIGTGRRISTSAVNAVQLIASSGQITSGSFALYGLAKT